MIVRKLNFREMSARTISFPEKFFAGLGEIYRYHLKNVGSIIYVWLFSSPTLIFPNF